MAERIWKQITASGKLVGKSFDELWEEVPPRGRVAKALRRIAIGDWTSHRKELREAIQNPQASDRLVEFVGTDGRFLRALLTEDVTSTVLSCDLPVAGLKVHLVEPSVLKSLADAGCLEPDSFDIAVRLKAALENRDRLKRSDGREIPLMARWSNKLPHFCGTKTGELIVHGELRIDPIHGHLTVWPDVEAVERTSHSARYNEVAGWFEKLMGS